jgi:hypothetical protein
MPKYGLSLHGKWMNESTIKIQFWFTKEKLLSEIKSIKNEIPVFRFFGLKWICKTINNAMKENQENGFYFRKFF